MNRYVTSPQKFKEDDCYRFWICSRIYNDAVFYKQPTVVEFIKECLAQHDCERRVYNPVWFDSAVDTLRMLPGSFLQAETQDFLKALPDKGMSDEQEDILYVLARVWAELILVQENTPPLLITTFCTHANPLVRQEAAEVMATHSQYRTIYNKVVASHLSRRGAPEDIIGVATLGVEPFPPEKDLDVL